MPCHVVPLTCNDCKETGQMFRGDINDQMRQTKVCGEALAYWIIEIKTILVVGIGYK